MHDVNARQLTVELSDEVIASRQRELREPEFRYKSDVLAKYASLVPSASDGAITSVSL